LKCAPRHACPSCGSDSHPYDSSPRGAALVPPTPSVLRLSCVRTLAHMEVCTHTMTLCENHTYTKYTHVVDHTLMRGVAYRLCIKSTTTRPTAHHCLKVPSEGPDVGRIHRAAYALTALLSISKVISARRRSSV
jgi:hypothetical protein